jgi:type IV pilus assembly protein PilO
MTNIQNVNTPDAALAERRTDRRLLQGVPLAAGGVLALVLLGGWVTPSSLRLYSDWQRLRTLEPKKQQLQLLRAQLEQTIDQQEKAADAERRLLGLIAGSGDISTFMAQVNLEAQRHGVRLDELQPAVAAPPPDASKAKTEAEKKAAEAAAAAQGCGALAQSGFTAQRRSLAASGRYSNLLAFMRALENLSRRRRALRIRTNRRPRLRCRCTSSSLSSRRERLLPLLHRASLQLRPSPEAGPSCMALPGRRRYHPTSLRDPC